MFCFGSAELKMKSLLTRPSNVLPLHLKPTFTPIFESSLKLKVMGLNPGYLLKSFVLSSDEIGSKPILVHSTAFELSSDEIGSKPIFVHSTAFELSSDKIGSKHIFVHSTAFAPIFTISCWFPHTSLATKRFEDCAILYMKTVSS